jgi:hypothetical protein
MKHVVSVSEGNQEILRENAPPGEEHASKRNVV